MNEIRRWWRVKKSTKRLGIKICRSRSYPDIMVCVSIMFQICKMLCKRFIFLFLSDALIISFNLIDSNEWNKQVVACETIHKNISYQYVYLKKLPWYHCVCQLNLQICKNVCIYIYALHWPSVLSQQA